MYRNAEIETEFKLKLESLERCTGQDAVSLECTSGVYAGVEVEVLGRNIGAGTSNLDLDAFGVELSATGGVDVVGGVGLVESNDLLADDVLARLQGRGKRDGLRHTLVGNKSLNSPLAVLVAFLGNLGPDGASAVGLSVRGNVGDQGTLVGKVDDIVTRGVVVPFDSEAVTCGKRLEVLRSLATVDVADDVGALEVLYGRVGRGAADVLRGAGASGTTIALGSVARLGEVKNQSVGGRVADESGESSGGESETHLDGCDGVRVRELFGSEVKR
ncbi:uncharacterized protein ColSpa_00852 [Colletotrichum spaethianum]|uniref:Uncharacterized protein n=1 Tax=Colletotrichum spaethianum TaxID=700344 RepID=A0AA37P4A4_9PEZI|nr:uncharacterized protein ColSpa_00852 [Colletotrichum spaethianum]GKT40671.1 hypothetical protein ColSpa_00852 [Colletotrichum spaethianum]